MSIETLFMIVNILVGLGVLALLVLSIFIFLRKNIFPKNLIIILVLIICLGVFTIPQVYERIFGLTPCLLCWLQRICIWPVAILTPIALYRKELHTLIPYFLVLLSIGIIIGLYHYSLQFGVAPISITCGAVGQSVSCGGIEVLVFDFLTIPLMSVLSQISLVLLFKKYTEK